MIFTLSSSQIQAVAHWNELLSLNLRGMIMTLFLQYFQDEGSRTALLSSSKLQSRQKNPTFSVASGFGILHLEPWVWDLFNRNKWTVFACSHGQKEEAEVPHNLLNLLRMSITYPPNHHHPGESEFPFSDSQLTNLPALLPTFPNQTTTAFFLRLPKMQRCWSILVAFRCAPYVLLPVWLLIASMC